MLVFPRRLALAAAGWSALLALVHAYWALGGTAGLDGQALTGTPAAINAIAILLCVLATGVALALADGVRSTLLHAGAWAAAAILTLRGLAGIVPGGDWPLEPAFFETSFVIGGLLFGAAAYATPYLPRGRPRFA